MSDLALRNPAEQVRAGGRWLRTYLEGSGQDRLILGLSGGVDSAVAALWAARAVGGERLLLVHLPYGGSGAVLGPATPAHAERDARKVATCLSGADFQTADIGPTVDAEAHATGLGAALRAGSDDARTRIAFGNLQARARALRLRTLANLHAGLVLGTGNRSEWLLGYFTLGGDEQADVGLLATYLKTQVWELARLLGVPDEVVGKAPAADLWKGQTDEGELGFSYEAADPVLYHAFPDPALAASTAGPPPRGRERVERDGAPGVSPSVRSAVLERADATRFKRVPRPTFRPADASSSDESGPGDEARERSAFRPASAAGGGGPASAI